MIRSYIIKVDQTGLALKIHEVAFDQLLDNSNCLPFHRGRKFPIDAILYYDYIFGQPLFPISTACNVS